MLCCGRAMMGEVNEDKWPSPCLQTEGIHSPGRGSLT